MFSMWETFARKRVERGIEIGEKRAAERWREEREALKKRNAELEELLKEKERE